MSRLDKRSIVLSALSGGPRLWPAQSKAHATRAMARNGRNRSLLAMLIGDPQCLSLIPLGS
jgi:hypothetical protein